METGREELTKALRREGMPVQKLAGLQRPARRWPRSMNLRRPRRPARRHRRRPRLGPVGRPAPGPRAARRGGTSSCPPPWARGVRRPRPGRGSPAGVYVEGLDDVMVHLARCCTPVPGDQIVGFVTRGRGVSRAPGRLRQRRRPGAGARRSGSSRWSGTARATAVFVATIEVLAFDRSRLLADVTRVVSEHHLNIVAARTADRPGPGQPDGLRRGAGRPRPSGVADRSLKHLDGVFDAYRQLPGKKALSPRWPTSDGPAARPDGHPRRAVARVQPVGGAVAAFAGRAERAGFGLAHQPRCSRTPRSSAAASATRATWWARRCTSSPTGTARCWRCGPRARPRWCGPSSSTTRCRPGRRGTSRPPSATSAPRPAATASTTSWAWRPSAPTDPDLDVEVIALAARLLRRPRARATSTLSLNSMGDADVPAGLRRAALRGAPGRARATSCATSTGNGSPPTRCGSSTASAPACRAATADVPASGRPPLRGLRRPLRPGAGGPRRPRGALRARPPAGAGARLLHPDHLRVRLGGPRRRPRTPSAAAAATTGWSRCSAARPPRASASASGSSGCCWPATPRGASPSDPPAPDAFVVDVTGGETARDLVAALRRAGLRAVRAYDGRSLQGPDEAGRPLGGPGRPHRRARGAGGRYGDGAPAAHGGEQRRCGWTGGGRGRRGPVAGRARSADGRGLERRSATMTARRATTAGATAMRTHLCGELGPDDVGQRVRLCGWVARRREHGEHLAFVDLRDHTGIVQCVVDGVGRRAQRVRGGRRRARCGAGPRARSTPSWPPGRSRWATARWRCWPRPSRRPFAVDDRAEVDEAVRLRYRYVDLRRPAHAAQPPAAGPRQRRHARGHGAPGVLRGGDAAAVDAHPRGGPGVRRAQPAPPRLVLRPAPEPPAGQAAAHGGRVRPLLPDRPVPARRGPAGRPPVRVHPARHRGVLRRPRTTCWASSPRRCSTPPRRPRASAPGADRAHDLARGHGPLRHRQARPALRHGAGRPRARCSPAPRCGPSPPRA